MPNNAKRLTYLRHAVQALALSCQDQLALFPSDVCRADELALDLENWCRTVLGNDAGMLTQGQASVLKAVDAMLDRMSGAANAHLWTDKALCNDTAWDHVRSLANQVLTAFQWPLDRPPAVTYLKE